MSLTAKTIANSHFAAALMCSSILAGVPAVAFAQDEQEETAPGADPVQDTDADPVQDDATPPPAPAQQVIRSILVSGAQRLEPETILSYIRLNPGDPYTQAAADEALRDLYATELFTDVNIRNNAGAVTIEVVENPIINRIVLEGNKRIKDDKIRPEINLAPRQIFTRSKVRADVARIIELYKRQGRFAASVEPKMVTLDQNRVDIIFEITEGPKSKVRQINILGNEAFSDGDLKGEMVTKEAGLLKIFSSNTSYDPDRLAFDQQKLRQFYLTEGYADFRVVSAVAELTPDKRDFIITYVVEEGERYKFGEVSVESQIRDFSSDSLQANVPMKTGDWFNAEQIDNTEEQLTELAGTFGYAFAEANTQIDRDRENLTMAVTFVLAEAPRVYIERVEINGNTLTQDKVIRREFRVAEGDAFNSLQVRRSTNRINSLGYFQENFEIEQKPGSTPDRIILEANVQEQPTGELSLSAGFSSLESFVLQGSVRQNNFRGRGQTVGTSLNWSRYSRSAQISFTEPYVFDKNFSLGVNVYRKDYNSFNFFSSERQNTFKQATTGFSVRAGLPLTEYLSLIGSYTFNYDDVTVDESRFFSDFDGDGVLGCEPILAGRYLCDALGQRISSIVGSSLVYRNLDNFVRPTRGLSASVTLDVAGLGGDVNYARLRANAARYWPVGGGFIFSLSAEGGLIKGWGGDEVRLTDRFQLGEPQMRGFDIRGIGPRVLRLPYVDTDGDGVVDTPISLDELADDRQGISDDALGGNAYYLGRAELEIPLGTGARELGLRPSIFIDAGALFNVTKPDLLDLLPPSGLFIPTRDGAGNALFNQAGVDEDGDPVTIVTVSPFDPLGNPNTPLGSFTGAFKEVFLGDSPKPRVSIGIGVNWNSPFGPFRIDVAHVLMKQEGDDTKTFSFNVGTQF